jgi:hypothetical protein
VVAPSDGAIGVEEFAAEPGGPGVSTACRVIALFEELQRRELIAADLPPLYFTTELTQLQRKVLRLLGTPKAFDG